MLLLTPACRRCCPAPESHATATIPTTAIPPPLSYFPISAGYKGEALDYVLSDTLQARRPGGERGANSGLCLAQRGSPAHRLPTHPPTHPRPQPPPHPRRRATMS